MAPVGHALVGRHAEQAEGDQGIWRSGDCLLCCVLDTLLYMKLKNVFMWALATIAVIAGLTFFWDKKEKQAAVTTAQPTVETSLNELPNLAIRFGDQSTQNLNTLTGDVVLVFFNPDCDHCQQEAEQIAANKEVFANWQMYFIASVDAKSAEEFGVKYKLTDANYHFAAAGVGEVFNAIGPLTQVPTILVYKNSKFVQKFEGVTPVDKLKQAL
jgi:thiol-disulfide isomerase/thioredoxin